MQRLFRNLFVAVHVFSAYLRHILAKFILLFYTIVYYFLQANHVFIASKQPYSGKVLTHLLIKLAFQNTYAYYQAFVHSNSKETGFLSTFLHNELSKRGQTHQALLNNHRIAIVCLSRLKMTSYRNFH